MYLDPTPQTRTCSALPPLCYDHSSKQEDGGVAQACIVDLAAMAWSDEAGDGSMKVSQAVLAVSIGAASLTLTACGRSDRPSPAPAESMQRPVEPRLLGVAYAPCHPDPHPDLVPEPRCAPITAPSAPPKPAKSSEPVNRGPASSEPLAAHRNVRLAQRDEDHSDSVVADLEDQVRDSPGNAGAMSDLAAAYIVRSQRRNDPFDLLLSVEAAEKAVKVAPTSPEALFNRALARELLFLDVEAMAAWDDYLRQDDSSPWAAEAKSRKAAIEAARRGETRVDPLPRLRQGAGEREIRELVRRDPQAVREAVENELFADWADTEERGDRITADRLLRVLHLAGDALAARQGETLVRDAVAAIERESPSSPRRSRLVEGHKAFREGHQLYRRREVGPAHAALDRARTSFEAGGSPFAARAAFVSASLDYANGRSASALRSVQQMKPGVPPATYPILRAHLSWIEGLGLSSDGKLLEALRAYDEALALLEKTGETRTTAEVHALEAESLELLGLRREAWVHGYQALRQTRSVAGSSRATRIVADAVLEEGKPEIALLFQDELVRREAFSSRPLDLTDALSRRAGIRGRVGRLNGAREDLHLARQTALGITDLEMRRQSVAHVSRIEGELEVATDPAKAVELLTSALDFYDQSGPRILQLAVRRTRARAYRLLKDLDAAEADLQAGFRLWEGLEKNLSEEKPRLAFLERGAELADEMIAFQAMEKRSPELAFTYADRNRSLVLPGRAMSPFRQPPLSSTTLRRLLPSDTALVQFSVQDDRLFVWILRGGEMRFLEQRVERAGLEDLVRRVRERKDSLSELFDLLVRPWLGTVPESNLVFVPDKALHAIPFSALRDSRTGRFLMESRRITVAPSASLYVNAVSSKPRPERPGRQDRALVIASPDFDRTIDPTLKSLDGAGEEGRAVAALYPQSDLLSGKDAGVTPFLAKAPDARWIHFSGHAVADDRNPFLSMLLLARREDGGPSVLRASDLYRLDLRKTDLVVLSACSTGAIPRGSNEGVTNLARAFQTAGVPTIVASLWEVDDRLTSKLFTLFHQTLLAHGDPASALREAQLALLHDPDPAASAPKAWGAFEVFEGSVVSPVRH